MVDDGNLRASRETLEYTEDPKNPEVMGNTLILETGDASDNIHVSQRPDGQLSVNVNGRVYTFNPSDGAPDSSSPDEPKPSFKLQIKSGGGNDNIAIDPNVTTDVTIDAGNGDDTVQAGGGTTKVYGGHGNDHIRLGSGAGYAEGNNGDDIMLAGTGPSVMYGNKGKDKMYAGSGPSDRTAHLDGGEDDDQLYGGDGTVVLNGGLGNDLLAPYDNNTVYTGKGHDTVWADFRKVRIYATGGDRLINVGQSTVTTVTPNDAGRKAFNIKGSDAFKQRVEDDLELLRASPAGQKMLEELDKAAERNGAPVNIELYDEESNIYTFSSTELDALSKEEQQKIKRGDPRRGFIKDGTPGAKANNATIYYDPSHIEQNANNTPPIVQFYHEMSHAWNGANGTFLAGSSTPTADKPNSPGQPNGELQAIGLPTDTPPFDYDNDLSTPPTTTNPEPFTENTLRKEMGMQIRTRFN
nr:M91 family zinc metallopeptidase [Pseudomonas sp. Marseille-Q1929]